MNPTIDAPQHILSDTDAQLVSAVAALDPALAHQVQLRLRALRLRLVAGQAPAAEPPRHILWHSLRWPWGRRG